VIAWLTDLESCASTNSWALEHLDRLRHGDVVSTARQLAGRGRDGRAWVAPPGTMTFSVVLDPGAADARSLALAAGLACIHAVTDFIPGLGAKLAIKWPNDVLLEHRKLAGILCEASGGRLVVGIGLNRVAVLPAELAATSLHEHGEAPADMVLLAAIRGYLLEAVGLCGLRGLAPLLPQLRARDVLLGRSVSVETRQGRIDGTGGGIDATGRLLVIVPGGGIAEVDAGHVTGW
jgi:BirA family transcriptional regulator, biotin operon repressor / biotin---[acetyl-CoA-carboxylase] ligase